MIKLSDLRLTKEQEEAWRADRERRANIIRSGKHPDTGDALRPGDEDKLEMVESFYASNWLYPERWRRYAENIIQELERNYRLIPNPLFAWEA